MSSFLQILISRFGTCLLEGLDPSFPGSLNAWAFCPLPSVLQIGSRAPLSILRQGSFWRLIPLFERGCKLQLQVMFSYKSHLCMLMYPRTPIPRPLLLNGHSIFTALVLLSVLLLWGSTTWLWFSWGINYSRMPCSVKLPWESGSPGQWTPEWQSDPTLNFLFTAQKHF